MKYGFIKVASATPKIRVADCKTNTINIIEQIKEAHKNGASLVVFPELCVTGYTCSDLFYQRVLLNAAEKSVEKILKETADLDIISIAGVPVAIESALYNCAAVIYKEISSALFRRSTSLTTANFMRFVTTQAVKTSMMKFHMQASKP